MSKTRGQIKEFLDLVVALPVQIGMLTTFFVIGYQVVMWLKNGVWIPVTFGWGIEYLTVNLTGIYKMEWAGIRKITIWILESPLSLMAPILGFFITMALYIFVEYMESFFTQTEGHDDSLNK